MNSKKYYTENTDLKIIWKKKHFTNKPLRQNSHKQMLYKTVLVTRVLQKVELFCYHEHVLESICLIYHWKFLFLADTMMAHCSIALSSTANIILHCLNNLILTDNLGMIKNV